LSEQEEILLDGSEGEGGGQILRTSLSLSTILGIPFGMERIRAGREKPGLRPQHLMAIQASARLSNGRAEGAAVNASAIRYTPQDLPSGIHTLDIGTAGAVSLLLHALYYPMAWSSKGGQLRLHGGTHVDKAPTFDYLEGVWMPMLQRCGLDVSLRLERCGFYPKGGGLIEATIPPAQRPRSLVALTRPPLEKIEILSLFGQPRPSRRAHEDPASVTRRMAATAQEKLHEAGFPDAALSCRELFSPSIGATCLVLCSFGDLWAGFTAWGAKGRPAEQVGEEAAQMALRFLESSAVVDEWMADQLLLPLALADEPSAFLAPYETGHLTTNASTIQRFLPNTKIRLTPDAKGHQRVEIFPAPRESSAR
jgi:RNA 3'-terminal phosphate cyclase (ATP)